MNQETQLQPRSAAAIRLVGGDSIHNRVCWLEAGVRKGLELCLLASVHSTHLRSVVRLENRQGSQLGLVCQIGILPNRGSVAEKRVMELGPIRPRFKSQLMHTSCHLLRISIYIILSTHIDYIYMYIYTHIYIYIHICVSIYICIHTYIHTYIYIYIPRLL